MSPERWREVEAVLDAALDLPVQERATYVAAACTGDHELRSEVEKLLAAVDAPMALVPDEPAAQFAAPVLARLTDSGTLDAPPRPSQALRATVPDRIGPYRIVADAGEGGMGVVYIAERDDGTYAKRVALKVVRRGLHLDARFNRRFQEERQILARLDHPNIARLLDGGVTDDGLPFFVMEYIEGEPVDRWCDGRRLSIEQRLEIFVKVCGAVAYLHKHGVVHRDLKPSNIMVTEEGEPKLLDFGIAKMLHGAEGAPTTVLTQTGQRLLTPDYASPEQVRGASVTEASDVYALGVLLYELLTARRPYRRRGRTLHQIERVILEDEPTRPSAAVTQPVLLDGGMTDGPSRAAALRATTPPRLRQQLRGDLDAIILTALRKEPERRYHSADEFAADVRRHLDGLTVTARGDGLGYRARKLVRRHRISIAAASIGVAAGVGLIVLAARTGFGPPEQGFGAVPRVQPGATRRVAFTPGLELDPELSPDGRTVAFVAPDTADMMRIHVRPLDGGQTRIVSASLEGYHRAPRWSPDGRSIAFQANTRLYVVPADGSQPPRVLVDAEPYALSVAWSPDGREIAYAQGTTINVQPVAGGPARRLPVQVNWPHSLRWSPDGRWLAFVDDNYAFLYGAEAAGGPISLGNVAPSSIWIVPVAAGGHAPLRITNDRALNTTPAWLPDSRGLLFVSNRDGDRDVYQVALGRDGRPESRPTRVTAGLGVHSISVSADGRRLAYAVFRNSSNVWSLPIRPDGIATEADLQPVTSGMQSIEGLSVTRDGQWIAFDSDRDGRQQIFRMPLTGGEPTRLTQSMSDEFLPSWSPDGTEIAYYSIDTTGRHIHVMNGDGSRDRLLGPWPPGQRSPAWSPDGRSLVFNASNNGASELFVATRFGDGEWERPIQITDRNRGGGMPRWSPLGNTIVYLREDGIWTASPDGGVPRQVLPIDPARRASLGAADWSADGQTIYYRWFDERWRTTIRAVAARGGASREIARLEAPDRQSRRGEMSCNAQRCFFTIAEHVGDVWTMELSGR
ncbi:MAG TPA: protein kinase [Gemmatimonadaceae bacterium]|nr:protein kinase [Gemmatimonadaceae bacterium]